MTEREHEELRAWSAVAWPHVDWTDAEVRVGAFHRVVLSQAGPIMRAATGTGHVSRAARELVTAQLVAGLELNVSVPAVLDSRTAGDDAMTAILVSRTPGVHGPDRDWDAELGRQYRLLLESLSRVNAGQLAVLPSVRAWCGGPNWPHVVDQVTASLPTKFQQLAARLVIEVLEAEKDAQPCFVHGDFGPHNILWHHGRPASLIDFDHACIADPAIDFAPLVGVYGAAAVASITEPHVLERAMVHRATLSLQVSCAAHLIGQHALSKFALNNFERRATEGTLHDPGGRQPGAL